MHWKKKIPHCEFEKAKKDLLLKLSAALEQCFTDSYDQFTLHYEHMNQQISNLLPILTQENVLSLAPYLQTQHALELSRCFRFGLPDSFLTFTHRPESSSILEQLKSLPRDVQYHLIDDDSYTGETMRHAKQLLSANHQYHRESFLASQKNETYDLIDLRDLIVGAYYGGLTIELPNGLLGRAPYIYPYVLPALRFQCPFEYNLSFSKQAWMINRDFFAALSNNLKIQDCDQPFINLAIYLGFSLNDSLFAFCDYHIQQFS